MKSIVTILLLGISLTYSPEAAVSYAKTYCNQYNPAYNNYKGKGGDGANFVSQSMYKGGQSFDGCAGKDDKGMIKGASDLKTCLTSKGWRTSMTRPGSFKQGYPVFLKQSPASCPFIATGISGNYVIVSSHTPDACNLRIKANNLEYYFL